MISVEDLDHDKISRLKETYALRSFEEIRKEELLSDNPLLSDPDAEQNEKRRKG